MAHVATLTIDHLKVAADLTDYPVLVIANGDAGWAELYALATEGGGDIRIFKSDDTTELPREIVSFSVIGETGEIYLKYSGTLSSTVDTDIHIYADGTSGDYAVGATYGRNAVWSDYVGVYHFQGNSTGSHGANNGTDTSISYSTSYGRNGGQGALFSAGSNSRIAIGSLHGTAQNEATIDTWVNSQNTTGAIDRGILGYNGWSTNGHFSFESQTRTAASPAFSDRATLYLYGSNADWSGSSSYTSTIDIGDDGWHKLTTVLNASAKTVSYYVDGALDVTRTATVSLPSIKLDNLLIGSWFVGGGYRSWNKWIDNMRVNISGKSANWITTEYNNQNSPSTFYAVTAVTSVIDQALTASAQASAQIVKQVQRDLEVTASATASFTRSVGRLLNATAQATSSFVRNVGRTLQVTAQGSPTLQAGLLYAQELIATAQATASIAYAQVTIVALTVTAQASTAITQIYTRGVALVATASATASFVRNSTLARTLVATASATASVLQSGLIISRTLLVTASATVTMTTLKTLSYIMSVTVGSVVSLLKDFGYIDKYPENDATYEDKYPID